MRWFIENLWERHVEQISANSAPYLAGQPLWG